MRPVDLLSEMDSMFDNFRTDIDKLFWPWGQRNYPVTSMTQRRIPPMDVSDLGKHYEICLEMPGIPNDKINIEVTQNTVEISAKYKDTKEEKSNDFSILFFFNYFN